MTQTSLAKISRDSQSGYKKSPQGYNRCMKKMVFVCIGTTRVVGDSVGPRVGDMLRARGVKAYVYGTTAHQITALNVAEYAKMIERRHRGDLVIVVDSTLGKLEDVGTIKLTDQGILPGGAFSSKRKRIGDIGVMAIVGESDGDRMLELKTRDEEFVQEVAKRAFKVLTGTDFN